MTDLLALADRVEKLTGPDRLVDAEIFKALGMPLPTEFFDRGISLIWDDTQQAFIMPVGEMQMRYEHPHFTASLDAAMTLIPSKSLWSVCDMEEGPFAQVIRPMPCGGYVNGLTTAKGATPALALTAACLRARASTKGEA
jgi:hypothetical protein